MPSRYQLILLDADRTLLDYDLAERVALQRTFEQFGFAYDEQVRQKYRAINSRVWDDFERGIIDKPTLQTLRFERLLSACGNTASAEAFNASYLQTFGECGQTIDGAVEICRELSQHCTLAIATNGISKTQRTRLEHSGLQPYITYQIVSEDAGYQKPQRGFFEYAFAVCGAHDKRTALMVGDSISSDISGAMEFGIAACWYNPGGAAETGLTPDYEIRRLDELREIIL